MGPLRWLGRNLSTLFLAFILAVIVWVSAVIDADPNEQIVLPYPVDIEVLGLDSGLLIARKIPTQDHLTVNAPRSVLDNLTSNPELVRSWIDLSGLGPGDHTVDVKTQIASNLAHVVKKDPNQIQLTLEPLSTHNFPVEVLVNGNPSLGYKLGDATVNPSQVTVSGPASQVNKVKQVKVQLDITGATDTVKRTIPLQVVDENGNPVTGATVNPQDVVINQVVTLLGGYRNVVVKVITKGQVANGYWLTNLSVSPPNVLVFSPNPELVNDIPGYVETQPVDLTGLNDDTDVRVPLNLPEGVSLVSDQSVLVRIGVAAQEGSLTKSLIPEVIGLPPELHAVVSPETLDVILAGPLPVLNNLTPASVRVTIDLTGLGEGTYQVTPVVDLLPNGVSVESILPQTVLITIGPAPTLTPTSGVRVTIVPTATPRPTATATLTPVPSPTPK